MSAEIFLDLFFFGVEVFVVLLSASVFVWRMRGWCCDVIALVGLCRIGDWWCMSFNTTIRHTA